MSKQTTVQPVPTIENEAVVPMSATKTRKGLDLFLMSRAAVGERTANKSQIASEIRQRLAEAADLANGSEEQQQAATTIADEQAKRLLRLRIEGVPADEVSGLLGDVFGYRQKKDGSPSKTPNGLGKMIRDRTVRLYNAHEYVNGRDGGSFFAELPRDKVAAVVKAVNDNKTSVWDAQKALGTIRSEVNVRPSLAFDAKRIITMAGELAEEGAADKVVNNPALQRAYGELLTSLAIIGQSAPDSEEEEAA
jgi:hypothetical protein